LIESIHFVDELTIFFERSKPDIITTLPNPYYWAGNEVFIIILVKENPTFDINF
jgi:hypothetical protein